MAFHRSEEKVKPFRLVKYVTLTSLMVIFVGTMALSALNSRWARNMYLRKSEDYAQVLVENLNHQVYIQFVIPVALQIGKIQLRNQDQFELMDRVVRNTLHSFHVETVNIFDRNNVISYSFDREMIGRQDVGGTGYHNALDGKSNSKLILRGSFWEMLLGFPKEAKLKTFAPLRAEKRFSRISGPVLGVAEIVQDLSEDYQSIFLFQIGILITSAAVMGVLFLALVLVVQRGEGIFEQRAQERLRLKAQLERSRHLSTIGEMVAGISHEIRNPLGIIRSSAELLKKKMLQVDPSNSFADVIIEEVGRLNLIITDFLNFARPKAPNMRRCQLQGVVEKNLHYLASQLQERNCTIVQDYQNPVSDIQADEEQLYQAFLNILINAMQAMPQGGEISIRISEDPDDGVQIVIEDNGPGLEEEILEKIWDPFFTTKEKGSGLGLVIVRNILESHGGAIRIENRPDGGARVVVTFPASSRQAAVS